MMSTDSGGVIAARCKNLHSMSQSPSARLYLFRLGISICLRWRRHRTTINLNYILRHRFSLDRQSYCFMYSHETVETHESMDMVGFNPSELTGPGRAGVVLDGLYRNPATTASLSFGTDNVSIQDC